MLRTFIRRRLVGAIAQGNREFERFSSRISCLRRYNI